MAGGSVALLEPPVERSAGEPPEARGLRRDQVRLLVSRPDAPPEHLRFDQLPRVLTAGDLLVVNASATLNASIPARRTFGMHVELHLSTQLPGGLWVVEVRQSDANGSKPLRLGLAGEVLRLPGGARASILAPYPFGGDLFARARLWAAALALPIPLPEYLERFGSPIRYRYVTRNWPLCTTRRSSPTNRAARKCLRQDGRSATPWSTHCAPPALRSRRSSCTRALRVLKTTSLPTRNAFAWNATPPPRSNSTHERGGRVIAVGTTVVRALETVTDDTGITYPGQGWTDLVIGPDRPMRAVDALLTGLHETKATHLAIVRAIAQRAGAAGQQIVDAAYAEALAHGYLLHEFGDVHLLLPV